MDTGKRYFRVRDDAPTDLTKRGLLMPHLTYNPEGNSLGDSWAAKWDALYHGPWGNQERADLTHIIEPCASDAPGAKEVKQGTQLSCEGGKWEWAAPIWFYREWKHHDPVRPYRDWDEG